MQGKRYDNSLNCVWGFKNPHKCSGSDSAVVEIDFSIFNLENLHDYVKLYDGEIGSDYGLCLWSTAFKITNRIYTVNKLKTPL